MPQPADSNGIVIVKLRRKLQYRCHVFFESVRPDIIFRLLQYLKLSNLLYHDIEIDVKNIPSFLIEDVRCDSLSLAALNNINIDDKIPLIVEKNNSSGAESDPAKIDHVNSQHNIADPINFRIDSIVDINGENNLGSTFLGRINNNSNIESNEKPLDAYRYRLMRQF